MQIDHVRQLTLAIDHAPPKVRAHGLRDAHSRPLVSRGKRDGAFLSSFRVSPADAWGFPSIELRAGNSWPVIILDCDGREATLRLAGAYINGRIPPHCMRGSGFRWKTERSAIFRVSSTIRESVVG